MTSNAESGEETQQKRGKGVDHLDDRDPLAFVYDGETLLATLYERDILFGFLANEAAVSNAFATSSMDVSLTPRGEEVLEEQ